MAFEIHVPDRLGDKALAPFFTGWNWYDDPEGPVVLCVERGTHIAPWAVTLFGAYAMWLREVRKKDVYLDYERSSYAGRFLERIGLPQLLDLEVSDGRNDDERIFPLTRIRESKEIAGIASSLMDLLNIEDEEIEGAVKYSLVELLRNVVQHSRSRIDGLVSAAYFPRTGIVDIAVADIGCGLRPSLKEAYPEMNGTYLSLNPRGTGSYASFFEGESCVVGARPTGDQRRSMRAWTRNTAVFASRFCLSKCH